MQLGCPRCRHVLEFSHRPPRFCSNCGMSLNAPGSTHAVAEDRGFRKELNVHLGELLLLGLRRVDGSVARAGPSSLNFAQG